MDGLAASTINVRLSAVRRLVKEGRHAGMLDAEEAARLTDVPNIRERGTCLGNWLTREQAKELLAVPDRSTPKGKRDYCILGLLVGCALRRLCRKAGGHLEQIKFLLDHSSIQTTKRYLGSEQEIAVAVK